MTEEGRQEGPVEVAELAEGSSVPWDHPEGRPVAAFLATLRGCLLRPAETFRGIDLSEDRWGALGYAMIVHVLGFSIAAGWTAILDPEGLTLALIRVAIAPLWVLVSVWVGSELLHGVLRLIGKIRGPRALTHRVLAYCYSTAVLGVIPEYGLRLGLVAAALLQMVAIKQAHRTSWWVAIVAVLLTWAVLLGGLLLAALSGGPLDEGAGS